VSPFGLSGLSVSFLDLSFLADGSQQVAFRNGGTNSILRLITVRPVVRSPPSLSILFIHTVSRALGYQAHIPILVEIRHLDLRTLAVKDKFPPRGCRASIHPVLDRKGGFRSANIPFAVGSMTERCYPMVTGLSVLVLATQIPALSLYPAFLATCCRLLRNHQH
jgi:hypothetical protein